MLNIPQINFPNLNDEKFKCDSTQKDNTYQHQHTQTNSLRLPEQLNHQIGQQNRKRGMVPDNENDLDNDNFYNPNNRLVTKEFIEETLYNVIGQKLCINNLYFYQTAFVHKSVYKKNVAPPTSKEPLIFYQTYESLEFMGDAWLGAIVTDYLYHRFPGQKEGFLTKVRAKIVRDKQLINFSEQMEFHKYVILPQKIEKTVGRKGAKFLEDVFEAFCGAVIEDLGVSVLQLFIKHLIERNVDFNDIILFDDDYKSLLLQLYQRHGWAHPTYTLLQQEGQGHQKMFLMGVDYIKEFDTVDLDAPLPKKVYIVEDPKTKTNEERLILSTGKAKLKKEAEQIASKEALEFFGMIV